ncbi:MAG: hypothetical protein WCK02_13075 [Bacteroidota bacterium]
MKKIINPFVLLVLILVLISCKKNDEDTDPKSSQSIKGYQLYQAKDGNGVVRNVYQYENGEITKITEYTIYDDVINISTYSSNSIIGTIHFFNSNNILTNQNIYFLDANGFAFLKKTGNDSSFYEYNSNGNLIKINWVSP